MKAFVLAAGFGQRMQPLTDTVPKPLLPVGNVPLIGYALALLRAHGITDVMVNAHHLADVLTQYLGDGSRFGVKLQMSHEPEILGTGGALKRAHKWLDETFVLINSDILVEHDLTAMVDIHRARKAVATMLLREPEPGREGLAVIEADAQDRVVRLYKEGSLPAHAQLPVQAKMFTGVHVLEPSFLDYIPKDVHTPIVQYGYAKAMANHQRVYAAHCTGYWQDAGTPKDYLQANLRVLDGKLKFTYIDPMAGYAHAPKRDLGHAIRLGERVHLGASVNLQRPVVVGNDTQLGERSAIGPFVAIGDHVAVGKQCAIDHAVLLPGASLAANSKVSHAVVAKQARLSVEPGPQDS